MGPSLVLVIFVSFCEICVHLCASVISSFAAVSTEQHFILRIARARHDLHNCIGHIHGFSEMWIEDFQDGTSPELRDALELILQTAAGMIARTNEALQPAAIERN